MERSWKKTKLEALKTAKSAYFFKPIWRK